MSQWLDQLTSSNLITVFLFCIVGFSLYQGFKRGASSSAGHLFSFMIQGVVIVVSIIFSWKLTEWLSPIVQSWLIYLNIQIPNTEMGIIKQMYYTFITGIRDFSLLRFGVIFLITYALVKNLVYVVVYGLLSLRDRLWKNRLNMFNNIQSPASNSLLGGLMGSMIGVVRALLIIAAMFIYVNLFPQAPFTGYIQASEVYQKGAKQIIQPVTGNFFENQFPVFTRAVESEFNNILQRKYEIIDFNIPQNIEAAAKQITAEAETDEEKARLLYSWVGTRIQYDWEKVRLYEEENKWMEQTPLDTFESRMGVCIDYSRLYAVMARAVDLEVKVVTGLGYDGRGGYGPHAWNEVFLSEEKRWAPLDTTWVSSGGDWFDSPHFYQSHVKDT